MTRKLTIVVTCTDRKSAAPSPALMVRNLPASPITERAHLWRDNLAAAPRVPLRQLYVGETWTQVRRLEATAELVGFEPTLLVASAGLGLVDAASSAPAYGATFTPGQPDSVGANSTQTQGWWRALADTSDAAREHLVDPTIFVLSKSYADAMAGDLRGLTGRDDVVVFGGSNVVPQDLRVAADRGLRASLGGTATSLNLRTAIAWLERLPHPTVSGNRDHATWKTWAAENSKPDRYDRLPLTDSQVIDFVRQLKSTDPSLSKSRALRLLRDSGRACEQRRFGSLFEEAMEPA